MEFACMAVPYSANIIAEHMEFLNDFFLLWSLCLFIGHTILTKLTAQTLHCTALHCTIMPTVKITNRSISQYRGENFRFISFWPTSWVINPLPEGHTRPAYIF
jgi:hypothetical protein